jgi:chromosome partitioning protein
MATGGSHPDQHEQPAATGADADDSPAGDAGWFSVDPGPEGLERSDADQQGPASTVSREAGHDALLDRPTAPPGPDPISAGMVHVDPEPAVDSPSGVGRPDLPPGDGPHPRPDRPGGDNASVESSIEGGEVAGGSPRAPAAAGSGTADESSEAPPRPDQPRHDPGELWHQPQRRSAAGSALGDAAPTGDAPAVDAAPAVGRGTGVQDAEPVPWTEPALPMPWPTPVEGRAGDNSGDVLEEAEPEQQPPDPRWPRLFTVGAEAAAAGLEHRGGREPHQPMAGHETPAADPTPRPLSETPAGPAADRPVADHDAGPAGSGAGPDANLQDHDGAGPSGADSSGEHTAGVASTEATGGQAEEDPASATRGPAEAGQMASGSSTSASGALSGTHANMAPAGLSNASVSGGTEGGGGVVNQRPEKQSIEEDEAAIAVREAVSRAAAQAGVDVSRETAGDTLTGVPTPPGAVVEALGDTPRIDSATAAKNARVTFKIHTDGVNGHGRILAVANQKGGVGKSTTAVNLGAYLALAGARILVVDLDPQGNASTGLGLDHREIEPSIYDVLTGETPPATAIRATTVANLHVLPSTIDLAGAEVELVSAMSREGRLRRALDSIHRYYDTVLIDCPPSLGLLTVNALAAADELLIPIQCEYYALEGLGQLLRNIELVRANLNPELRIGGIVLTMYDGRTRLAEQVVSEVRKHFSDLVYQTVVPRSVRLSEAPGYGLPIALYDPLSRGGIAYRDLAFELAERSGLLAPTGEGAI